MIKDIIEVKMPSYATIESAKVNINDMGERTITAQVKINGNIAPDFSYDWEIEFKGERYIMPLRQPQASKDNENIDSVIDLTFYHWAEYELQRQYFVTLQPIETGTAIADKYIASVSLNLGDFCTLLSDVIKYYYGAAISVQLNPEWKYDQEPSVVEISYSYIWEVIQKLYEIFGVHWRMASLGANREYPHGTYILRIGYEGADMQHVFEYGFEGGLLKIERQAQDDKIRNMILGRGGEKNLPARYFKQHDDKNASFSPDPDWIPELKDIYFSELHGATFRSYIQGWKAAHLEEYRADFPDQEWEVTVTTADNAYAPWAWMRGFTDSTFNPIEFVADKFDTSQNGYGVVPDSSIEKYGELIGGLENNEDIYPTIQGVEINGSRIDEAIEIEPITSDDVEDYSKAEAEIIEVAGCRATSLNIQPAAYDTLTIPSSGNFEVPKGMTANLDVTAIVLGATLNGNRVTSPANYAEVVAGSQVVTVYNALTNEPCPATAIPQGTYYYEVEVRVHNLTTDSVVKIIAGDEHPKLTYSELSDRWKDRWHIWVKNIWQTQKGIDENGNAIPGGESDAQYAERVWRPILGDKEGNEAKVVFSDGNLAVSDYEFTIIGIPEYEVKQCRWIEKISGKVHIHSYESHWKIALAKSDADLKSTGKYVPSTIRQAQAGDHFFFIGIDMPHMYVVEAEKRLDDWKKDELGKVSEDKPTWVVGLDPVKIHNYGEIGAIANSLFAGGKFVLKDKRFTPIPIDLYIQSISYDYKAPTEKEANLLPDVQIVLSNDYSTQGTTISQLSGEVSALQKQVGALSNIEQVMRAVGDRIYLRKDGREDVSLSPTRFMSLLSSTDFRSGLVGGAGWGIFEDNNGNRVLEIDKINVRQDIAVNTLVINQVEGRGGMEISSAATMEVTNVVDKGDEGYYCYFDQKNGTVANLFHIDDIAYCHRFTPENGNLKFYKRRVIAVGPNYIFLTKGYSSVLLENGYADTGVNGSGIPEAGDSIVQYGNYTDTDRQYVKVRDVVGGGYERYIENLNYVGASGTEYYFVGRQTGMYGGKPRWFIGNTDEYIEYRDGKLKIKAELDIESRFGSQTLADYIKDQTSENLSAYTIDITDEVIAIPADANGVQVTGSLPVTTSVRVFKGSVIDPDWKFYIPPSANEYYCKVDNSIGTITIYGLNPTQLTFTIPVVAVKDGMDNLTTSFSVYKAVAGAEGADGQPATIYKILPSVDCVTKDVNGTLSANSITCIKQKVTGNSQIAVTNENYLYAKVDTTTANGSWVLIADTTSAIGKVSIDSNTTAVTFELRPDVSSTAVVFDRERIPVLTDAEGLEIGGENLLLNSDYLDGLNYWLNDWGKQYTLLVTTETNLGRYSEVLYVTGQTSDTYYVIGQTVGLDEDIPSQGAQFTYSCYLCNASSQSQVFVEMQGLDDSGNEVFLGQEDVTSKLTLNRYVYISKTYTVPSTVKHLAFKVRLVRNGIIMLNSAKLERGNKATQWSASPKDISYLRKALAESTSIDGGLILSSLIKTGYTDSLGNRITQSGLNGIFNEAKPGGGVAVWAGGDEQDALDTPVSGMRTATMLFRQDGTGYAAKNVIKFEEERIRVGDGVVMDKSGFVLIDGEGQERLRISDVPINAYSDIIAAGQTAITYSSRPTLTITYGNDGYNISSSTATFVKALGGLNKGYVINATITLLFSATYTIPSLSGIIYRRPSIVAEIYTLGGDTVYTQSQRIEPFSGSNTISLNLNYMVEESGSYRIRVYFDGIDPVNNPASVSTTGTLTISGNVLKSFANQTILCSDGFASVWGNALLYVNQDQVAMRLGSFAFGIDSNGFRKSTDGGLNWVSANI